MKLNKQYILIGLLIVSLCGNLFQFLYAHNEIQYAQLGRNLVTSEEKTSRNLIVNGGNCETIGALRFGGMDGVLTCSPNKQWIPAACDQKGLIAKDDFGLILACDGEYWQIASQSPIQNNVNGNNTYIGR